MLSVVIPLYNSERNIAGLIDSLLTQKLKEAFEIIVIDDCSSDDSFESVRKFKNDENVHLMRNEKNNGNGFVKNLWAKLAKWNFVFFIDDHCQITDENFLQKSFDAIRESGADWLTVAYEVIPWTDDFNIVRDMRRMALYGKNKTKNIVDADWTTVSAVALLVKKGVFEHSCFPEDFWNASAEDTLFQIQAEKKGCKFRYVDEIRIYHSHLLTSRELFKKAQIEAVWFHLFIIAFWKEFPSKPLPYLEGYLELNIIRFVVCIWLGLSGSIIWGLLFLIVPYGKKFIILCEYWKMRTAILTIAYIMVYDVWKLAYLIRYGLTRDSFFRKLIPQYVRWKGAYMKKLKPSHG